MASLVPRSLLSSLILILLAPASPAQDSGITQKYHPWGRFQPGAWRRVRVVTETFDQDQTLTNIAETKTTLKEVDPNGVALLVETVVNVGGKQVRTEPQLIKQGWYGQLPNQQVKVTQLGSEMVTIQNRQIPCKVQQLEIVGPTTKTVTKIYYSDTVAPYILKRQSVKTDLKEGTWLGETTVEVIDLGVPWRILANINTFLVKAVHRHPKGSRTTLSRISMRVPGQEICRTSQDFDLNQRLVRRSRMELLDYGVAPDEKRPGLFRRKRPGRLRRLHRFSPYRLHQPAETEG